MVCRAELQLLTKTNCQVLETLQKPVHKLAAWNQPWGSIYTTEMGRGYKSGLPPPLLNHFSTFTSLPLGSETLCISERVNEWSCFSVIFQGWFPIIHWMLEGALHGTLSKVQGRNRKSLGSWGQGHLELNPHSFISSYELQAHYLYSLSLWSFYPVL